MLTVSLVRLDKMELNMNKFGKSVWAGLFINIMLLCSVWYISTQLTDIYDDLAYSWRQVVDFLPNIILPFSIAVLMQIISLPMLFKNRKIGLTLAIIGSVVMLPLSFVFMNGYMFSYEKHRNKNLRPFINDESNTPTHALHFKTSGLRTQGGLSLVIGMMVGFSGSSIGWILVCGGVVSLLNASRLNQRVMIGLVRDQLIITPAMCADTYLIPTTDVTLIKQNKHSFKFHIQSAGIDRKCSFNKKMIAEKNYQPVLEDILSQLANQVKDGTTTSDDAKRTQDV